MRKTMMMAASAALLVMAAGSADATVGMKGAVGRPDNGNGPSAFESRSSGWSRFTPSQPRGINQALDKHVVPGSAQRSGGGFSSNPFGGSGGNSYTGSGDTSSRYGGPR